MPYTRRQFVIGGAAIFGSGALSVPMSLAAAKPDLAKVTLDVGQISAAFPALLSFAHLGGTPYKVSNSTFVAAPPVLTALASGSVDLSLISLTATAEAQSEGIPLSAVAEIVEAQPSFQLIAAQGSGISSVADLAGKTVAVYRGTAAEGLLVNALQSAGLTESNVTLVNLPPSSALAAFQSGQVAAWSTWQPYSAEAVVEYGASVVPTTGSEWNTNYIVASKAALANAGKSLAIGDYIERLLKAANYARQHPLGWQAAYASATGLSTQLANLTAGSFDFSIAPLSPQVPNVPYRAALLSLLSAGMISSAPADPESIFDHRYDKALKVLEKSKAV